jgi:hypothetical protein
MKGSPIQGVLNRLGHLKQTGEAGTIEFTPRSFLKTTEDERNASGLSLVCQLHQGPHAHAVDPVHAAQI